MKNISLIILCAMMLAFSLSGCADKTALNEQLIELKREQVKAYADGMKACGDNQGCQVGLTAYIFGGGADIKLQQDPGPIEYAQALLPYANLFLQGYGMFLGGGGSGSSSALYLKGDHNTIIGFNRLSADRSSSIQSSFDNQLTDYFNNRWYTMTNPGKGGNIGEEGIEAGSEVAE